MREPVAIRTATGPVHGRIRPPGSKSITIRALAAAALADGRSHLYDALVAEDTEAMVGALRALGIDVDLTGEPWAINGGGGHVRSHSGTVDAGESGLTARIVMVLAALSEQSTTIGGRGRLLQRPIGPLVSVLTAQGVSVQTTEGHLPVTINGQGGLWGGSIEVDCTKSSQFATALLLGAPTTTEKCRIRVVGLGGSGGYLDTTVSVMEAFGAKVTRTITGFEVEPTGYMPTDYMIEPDASAAVYPMVAAGITGGSVEIEGLGSGSTQPDLEIAWHLADMGCAITDEAGALVVSGPDSGLRPIQADLSASPDGALALAVACAFADGPSRLTGLHSLEYKESDRLRALTTEMAKLGVVARAEGSTLVVEPAPMHGAVIDPHGDHRIAMSLAVAGLRVPGVEVADADVVNKTWPGFWEALGSLTPS